MKLAPVFYDGVSEVENRAGDIPATSNQLQKPSDSKKKPLKLKNLRICQNSNMVKTENFYKLGPIFGMENPSNTRLWHTVMVTSKLLMDPTNNIASDQQVWLLAQFFVCYLCIICRLLLSFLSRFLYDN